MPSLLNRNERAIATAILLGLAMFALNWTSIDDWNRRGAAIAGLAANTGTDTSEGDLGDDAGRDGPTFRWDYLDLDRAIKCGSDKCLFRSSSRLNDTASVDGVDGVDRENGTQLCGGTDEHLTGYLVDHAGTNAEFILDGWEITHYLVGRFGIKHFFLEPPVRVPLDKPRFGDLFASLRGFFGRRGNFTNEIERAFSERRRSTDGPVSTIVQKTRIAPTSSREMRQIYTKDFTLKYLEELLDGFREERGMPGTYNGRSHEVIAAAEGCGFFARLDDEAAKTTALLRCEPLVALDFQVILDTSGNLYHLDLDRVITNIRFSGGLKEYSPTEFDSTLRLRLKKSLDLLDDVRRWIRAKRQQILGANGNKNATVIAIPQQVVPSMLQSETMCKGNWEAEEARILASTNLPCLATERVAAARQLWPTGSTRENNETGEKDGRLRHPLLVAMLQRVIKAGFYENEDTKHWDCNVFGDRVVA